LLTRLLKLLDAPEAKPLGHDDLRLAVAILLIEAAHMDDSFDAKERGVIEKLLRDKFHLTPGEEAELVETAEAAAKRSAQLHPYTRTAFVKMSPPERCRLIEMLWEVAYADGVLDPEEEVLLRRIAGLIYVSDEERVAARLRVAALLKQG
jgi:uncharacterized tellurite resistance protein B-like protein